MSQTVLVISYLEKVIDGLSSVYQNERNDSRNNWFTNCEGEDVSDFGTFLKFKYGKLNNNLSAFGMFAFKFLSGYVLHPFSAVGFRPIVDVKQVRWDLVGLEVAIAFQVLPY